jgi:hypothetical protein
LARATLPRAVALQASSGSRAAGRIWSRESNQIDVVLVGPSPDDNAFAAPSHVDTAPFMPLTPASDHQRQATEACDALRRQLLGGWLRRDPETGQYDIPVPYIDGVTIEDVHLEGTWPHTRVAVHLRDDRRPEWLFARAIPVWDDAGQHR